MTTTTTMYSFSDLGTGKAVGALMLTTEGDIDVKVFTGVRADGESMEVGRYYTRAELVKLDYRNTEGEKVDP